MSITLAKELRKVNDKFSKSVMTLRVKKYLETGVPLRAELTVSRINFHSNSQGLQPARCKLAIPRTFQNENVTLRSSYMETACTGSRTVVAFGPRRCCRRIAQSPWHT